MNRAYHSLTSAIAVFIYWAVYMFTPLVWGWSTLPSLVLYFFSLIAGWFFCDIDQIIPFQKTLGTHRNWLTHSAFIPILLLLFLIPIRLGGAVTPTRAPMQCIALFQLLVGTHLLCDIKKPSKLEGFGAIHVFKKTLSKRGTLAYLLTNSFLCYALSIIIIVIGNYIVW